ncbi:hypothetical protein MRX96_023331 [Rhipicephalus microplus]
MAAHAPISDGQTGIFTSQQPFPPPLFLFSSTEASAPAGRVLPLAHTADVARSAALTDTLSTLPRCFTSTLRGAARRSRATARRCSKRRLRDEFISARAADPSA